MIIMRMPTIRIAYDDEGATMFTIRIGGSDYDDDDADDAKRRGRQYGSIRRLRRHYLQIGCR